MRLCWLVLSLALLAAPAQAQSLAERLDAARAATQAEIALAEDADLRAFSFEATVRGGVLTLMGRVETAAQRERAAEVAAGVEGVTSVENRVATSWSGAAASAPDLPPAPEPADTAGVQDEEATPEAEPAPAPAAEPVYHTVQRGDVLGAIARRYGVSVRQIQQLNGLRGTNIRVGQRLRVK
jgi:LysM repeat protein